MQFKQYYVVLLRKGSVWSGEDSPELDELQERHIAYQDTMHRMGKLAVAGPVKTHSDSDLRGISIFHYDEFVSVDELRALVEQDPKIKAGILRAEYLTWRMPADSQLDKPLPAEPK
jgi:uncharacterized protein YciI